MADNALESAAAAMTYQHFEDVCGPQLFGSSVPRELWVSIFDKLRNSTLDAGAAFGFAPVDDDDTEGDGVLCLCATADLEPLPSSVWLIDHAWTFRIRGHEQALRQDPALRRRVASMLLGRAAAETATVADVTEWLWKRARTYRLASESQIDEEACWYVLDEVGTSINPVCDEEDANAQLVPIFYPPTGTAYDILFLTKPVSAGTMISYNVAAGGKFAPQRHSHPKFAKIWMGGDEEDEIDAICERKYAAYRERCAEQQVAGLKQLRDVDAQSAAATAFRREQLRQVGLTEDGDGHAAAVQYRLARLRYELDHGEDAAAAASATDVSAAAAAAAEERPVIAYYSDMPAWDNLHVPGTRKVTSMEEADIAIITMSEPETCELMAEHYPNVKRLARFPDEAVFTNKSSLSVTIRTVLGQPQWLPETFDATAEADLFTGAYLSDVKASPKGEAALWIVKATGMSRSRDMFITRNLDLLLRVSETGPKVVSRYIERPLLWNKLKFDLRVIVSVAKIAPLQAYMYNNLFIRLAKEEFSLDDFDVYEKHWTVMNYTAGGIPAANQIKSQDLSSRWEQQYGAGSWKMVNDRIRVVLFETFGSISLLHHRELQAEKGPKGFTLPKGASYYGIDLMIDEAFNPQLLEVNFCPDIARACNFYPDFIDDVFSTAFLNCPRNHTRLGYTTDDQLGQAMATTD